MEEFLYNIGLIILKNYEKFNMKYELPESNQELFPLFVGWNFVKPFFPKTVSKQIISPQEYHEIYQKPKFLDIFYHFHRNSHLSIERYKYLML